MKKIETTIYIDAPTKNVWQALTNFKNYSNWNPFICNISGIPQEGEQIHIQLTPIHQNKTMKFHPKLLSVKENNELIWKGKVGIKGIFDGLHIFKLSSQNQGTLFYHAEEFSGILVPFFNAEQLKPSFIAMNEALKKYVEHKKASSGGLTNKEGVMYSHKHNI